VIQKAATLQDEKKLSMSRVDRSVTLTYDVL